EIRRFFLYEPRGLRSYCERSDSCPDQRRISEGCPHPPRILGQAAGCPIQGWVLCAVHSAALQREEARVVKKNVRSTQIATPNSLKPCTAKPCTAPSIIVETRAYSRTPTG